MVSILANVAAPIVLNVTGNMAAIAGIIPIEAIVLWLWWTRWCKVTISLLKVLLVVALLNILTSIVGIPFLWNQFMSSSVGLAIMSLPFFAGATIVAEAIAFQSGFKNEARDQRPSRRQIWGSVIVANLLSYIFLFTLMVPAALETDWFSRVTPSQMRQEIRQQQTLIIYLQQEHYLQHQAFAGRLSDMADIPDINWSHQPTLNDWQREGRYELSDRTLRSDLVETEMIVSRDRVDVTSTFRRGSGSSLSTGVLFATENGQLFGGYCQLERDYWSEPPPDPSEIQLVGNEIQCPPMARLQWVSRE
jgi:hypothetical protein